MVSLSFLQLLLAFLHGFHRNFSLQASNLDQQADFLKAVQDCGFLLLAEAALPCS